MLALLPVARITNSPCRSAYVADDSVLLQVGHRPIDGPAGVLRYQLGEVTQGIEIVIDVAHLQRGLHLDGHQLGAVDRQDVDLPAAPVVVAFHVGEYEVHFDAAAIQERGQIALDQRFHQLPPLTVEQLVELADAAGVLPA